MTVPASPWAGLLTPAVNDLAFRRYLYFDLGDYRALTPQEVGEYVIEIFGAIQHFEAILGRYANALTPAEQEYLTATVSRLRTHLLAKDST